MILYEKYLTKSKFDSYEDFTENCNIEVPDDFNFAFDVIDELAEKTPDKIGLLWINDDGEEKRYSFKDLKEASNRAANFFLNTGIQKGDFVMLILNKRYEFWECILGLHKIGAIAIPATHLLTQKDIIYRNNAASVKMIVTIESETIQQNIQSALSESPTVEYLAAINCEKEGWINLTEGLTHASGQFERPVSGALATKKDDDMLLYFTSGTTGYPKMVMHDHSYPLGHISTAKFWHNCEEDGIHLTVADSGWAKCMWGKLYGQWLCETCIFVYDFKTFAANDLLDKICKYKITTFCAPPTIYRFLIQEDLTQYDFSHLRHATTAGEALNPEVFAQFRSATGHKIYEGFGQTETCIMLGNWTPYVTPKIGAMGVPSPLYDIDLVDENDQSVEVGDQGEIVIRVGDKKPVGLFKEYYKADDITKAAWHDGVYHTGDLAWKDEDGYYWFVGRSDDVIKSSGYRIGPFEVESALMEHPGVLECAITGVPDPIRGTVVKATVVLSKGYEASDALAKELQDHVKTTTAPYKYPRVIEFVDSLPKTISGKIRRNRIRETDEAKQN